MWRAKKNLKRDKQRAARWKRAAVIAGLSAAVGCGGFIAAKELGWVDRAARVGRFFAPHVRFSLREVQVNGTRRLAGSEVVTMSGLRPGMSMWEISLGAVEKKLLGHPWVRNAVARREFPHRVVIEIEERRPRAVAALERFYYVDADGFIFREVGKGEETDLPIISGLDRNDWVSRSVSFREKIRELLEVSDLFAERSLPLSEVRFAKSGSVVFYPIGLRAALHMGWGEWDGKLERLERVLSAWKGSESRLAELDVSFRDQVVARLRPSEG
jgi:cell division protein FtsQ